MTTADLVSPCRRRHPKGSSAGLVRCPRDALQLARRLRKLLEDTPFVKRVRALSQPMLPNEPLGDMSKVSIVTYCVGEAGRHGPFSEPIQPGCAPRQQLTKVIATEPVLGSARLDFLAPRVGLDPVLLALTRGDRSRLGRALAPQREPTVGRRALHLMSPPRELLERCRRHVV